MKGVVWGTEGFHKKAEQAELRKQEDYIGELIENGATREEIEEALESLR